MRTHAANFAGTALKALVVLSAATAALAADDDRIGLCAERSCYPATGNLLAGREKQLYASSTCGLARRQRYCIVSHLQDEKKCSVCDSTRPWEQDANSHRIENVVSTFSTDRLRKWWQAENGVERTYIQLDLGAEFHFTHLVVTFKTFRPRAMLIERSFDFGTTWHVYRYFAQNCGRSFPGVATGPIRNLADVICEERYSDVTPSTEGEVIFKVLPPNIEIDNPYAPSVQDLLKLTNLRINFTELHTLGDDLLDRFHRTAHSEKYYYAIYDMVVRGSCSCYGHASRCIPTDDKDIFHQDMVYGKCECSHNTRGLNCEQCQEFYNDLPWKPARGTQTNACKRCECHEHATRCHFDPAVFEATNKTSGGVCDDCAHNTMGRNCQECQHFFYRDPERDIRDPLICKQCDCDPRGSQNKGECDSHDEPESDLVAGRCTCKSHATGRRCDMCVDGFWNMNQDNPDGCQACECSTLGTFENRGCDKLTGTCTCKRYVMGINCDQCLAEFWGLSNSDDGCQQCDCDPGGSVDNRCDAVTGQCTCRPNIIGRRCDQPKPGYFVADLSYLLYEAEYALGEGRTQVVIREATPGFDITWTGPGFMRAYEGDSLDFIISDIPRSMSYEIVIRYESQMPQTWSDVRVKVVRPDIPDPDGVCANQLLLDDDMQASLSTDSRYYRLSPAVCFETGKTYQIKLEFPEYSSSPDSSGGSVPNILIDSIVLVPVLVDIIPNLVLEMPESLECARYELDAGARRLLPERCEKGAFVIGATIQNQAIACDCDPTGSESTICGTYGGQCRCKPNVVGRRCDQCAAGAYGFGPQGCFACNCDGRGARDNFCDVLSGQCLCGPSIFGRACDRCRVGFFGFPNCQRCQCNNHADSCDDSTGQCQECRDLTTGSQCEGCLPGFYGDPRTGSAFPCRPCQCPGGEGSGYQHSDQCILDPRTRDMRCYCPPGYAGSRCEHCADNFYGNAASPGGTCKACGCNNNIDRSAPGGCDQSTGTCLRCLFNTEGEQCETCVSGYYGDATRQNCQKCICNMLGSNHSAGEVCDRSSGQCPCLPNVIGQLCDQCVADHWKLASGEGCELCDCDPIGSKAAQCNEFDGQCECIPGRGGRRCDECEALQWGDPTLSCQTCDCDVDGSESLQCDTTTGQCLCLPGVAGVRCDRCDRGTSGVLPNCVSCGECFDNWDAIVRDIRGKANDLIRLANTTKSTGILDAYDKEFIEIQNRLAEVNLIIEDHNGTAIDAVNLMVFLETVRGNLTDSLKRLEQLETDISVRGADITKANNQLAVLQGFASDVVQHAEDARTQADKLIQADINGAFNNIQEKHRRSKETLAVAKGTEAVVNESAQIRADTENYELEQKEAFDAQVVENDKALTQLDADIGSVSAYVRSVLNKQVCDRRGLASSTVDCDAACGGGGCSSCGLGQSCSDGAKGKALAAEEMAAKTSEVLDAKMRQATDAVQDLQSALENATAAYHEADDVRRMAAEVKSQSDGLRARLAHALENIANFLDQTKASPDEVRTVSLETLALEIPLSGEQISELAREISETIRSLTDIDTILNATSDDVAAATNLKARADDASKQAASILKVVQDIYEQLAEASMAQNRSRDAIDKAVVDVKEAQQDLAMIESVTTTTLMAADKVSANAKTASEKALTVRKKSVENEANLKKAEKEAKVAREKASESERKSNDLQSKYTAIATAVDARYNASQNAKERVERLTLTSSRLATYIQLQRNQLHKMQTEFGAREQQLDGVSKQISMLLERMQTYTSTLETRERFHKSCIYTGPAQ